MPKESIDIALRYIGPDVNDGTMSIQDVVPVLQGFSNAYGKIAATEDPTATHRLRITGVKPGSAIIALDVWRILGENAAQIGAVGTMTSAGYFIVKKIIGVIRLRKHVQNKPYSESIALTQDNSVVVNNYNNVTIQVPLEVYELFKSGLIDGDLNKIASPIVPGKIDSAEIEAVPADGIALKETITAADRPYFDTSAVVTVTTTGLTWLVAKLNSLTKSTNGGFLYLNDGTRVYYSYKGENPMALHQIFGNYDGPVRIHCQANMDESLKVVSVDIFDIERAQGDLFSVLQAEDDDVG